MILKNFWKLLKMKKSSKDCIESELHEIMFRSSGEYRTMIKRIRNGQVQKKGAAESEDINREWDKKIWKHKQACQRNEDI